jgi:hypothetical protein
MSALRLTIQYNAQTPTSHLTRRAVNLARVQTPPDSLIAGRARVHPQIFLSEGMGLTLTDKKGAGDVVDVFFADFTDGKGHQLLNRAELFKRSFIEAMKNSGTRIESAEHSISLSQRPNHATAQYLLSNGFEDLNFDKIG